MNWQPEQHGLNELLNLLQDAIHPNNRGQLLVQEVIELGYSPELIIESIQSYVEISFIQCNPRIQLLSHPYPSSDERSGQLHKSYCWLNFEKQHIK